MTTLRGMRFLPDVAYYDVMTSPVGGLTIVTSKQGLHAVLWDVDCESSQAKGAFNALTRSKNDPIIKKTKQQLQEYFQGKRQVFDLPLVLNGTVFQKTAWQQLLKIPYGQTISYGEQAQRLGHKHKARAVGLANGLNPISIIVPCHRVIGANGKLVGFAGGLDRKAHLLRLEQAGKTITIC